MFPNIIKPDIKPRSFSINVEQIGTKQKAKRNISHYSYKIVEKLHSQPASNDILNVPHKETQGLLIIIIENVEAFLKEIAQTHKYQQFLKFKDFLNEKQITQFFLYISNVLINLQSTLFEHHYCTFQLNKKAIDIETADSKTISEVITEFLHRHQKQHENLFIFGGDFQLIHKSDFRQIIYISEQRIDKQMNKEIKINEKVFRFRTQIQRQYNDTNSEDILIDHRVYQIGMHKKNKEIKLYLQQQNNEKRDLNQKQKKAKELQIKKISSGQREKRIDLSMELPQICDQIYEKFKRLFQIEYINVDKEVFSQFLLLCELSIYYSKNLTLQQQLSRLNDDNEKFRLLINNVLYFEFKILKSMNLNLQQLQNCVTQTLLKFINQDTKCQETLNKIYWNAFLRFKIFYIDQKWTTSDFRYFLLLLNEESPLTLQHYLQLPIRELSKTIFSLNEDLLQQIVWQILYTKLL